MTRLQEILSRVYEGKSWDINDAVASIVKYLCKRPDQVDDVRKKCVEKLNDKSYKITWPSDMEGKDIEVAKDDFMADWGETVDFKWNDKDFIITQQD